MSDCVKCARLLSDYVDQQCDGEQREFVERHLSACPDCTERLAMLLSMLEVAAEAPEPVPEGFSGVVMKRIDESKRRRFMPMRFTMMAAAAIALVFIWRLGFGNLPKGITMTAGSAPASASSKAMDAATGGGEAALFGVEENTESAPQTDGGNGSEKGMMRIEGFMGSNIVRSFTSNSLLAEAPLAPEDEDDAYLPVLEANNNGRYAFILLVQDSVLSAEQSAALFDGISRFGEEGDAAVRYYLVSLEDLETLQVRLTEQGLTAESLEVEVVSKDYPLVDEQAPYGAVVVY